MWLPERTKRVGHVGRRCRTLLETRAARIHIRGRHVSLVAADRFVVADADVDWQRTSGIESRRPFRYVSAVAVRVAIRIPIAVDVVLREVFCGLCLGLAIALDVPLAVATGAA